MTSQQDFHAEGFCTRRLSDFVAAPDERQELIDCYCAIFNATGEGEWSESWTPETAEKKLFGDTVGQHDCSFVTTWRLQGKVVGLMIVCVAPLEQAFLITDLPPGSQNSETFADLMRQLTWICGGGTRVSQYREFGIVPQARGGFAPIARIIHDSCAATVSSGAVYGLFWTARKRRLFPLVSALDMRVVFDFADAISNVLVIGDSSATVRRLELAPAELNNIITERLRHLRMDGRHKGDYRWLRKISQAMGLSLPNVRI